MAQQSNKGKGQVTSVAANVKSNQLDGGVDGGDLMILDNSTVPDHLKDRVSGDGRGSENVGTDDLVIPRLTILQALSPELEEGKPEFIKGAKQGDLINTVSRQNYGKSVYVVNVHYSKLWLVWRDRKRGGGFYGAFPDPEQANARAKEEGGKAEGIEAQDTPTHLCLLPNRSTGAIDEIMIPMPRTKAKVSRQWNSQMRMAGGDRFARVWQLSSVKEENNRGESYFNYVVAASGFPAKKLYDQAEKLFHQIAQNERRVVMDVTGMGVDDGEGAESSEM